MDPDRFWKFLGSCFETRVDAPIELVPSDSRRVHSVAGSKSALDPDRCCPGSSVATELQLHLDKKKVNQH